MIVKTILAAMLAALSLSSNAQTATFKSFSYKGNDTRFNKSIDNSKQFYNPILAGFYPDPSICRVGDTFYLVNSSFSFYPGVPLSTSKDLVNWKPLGHVLDRKSQLPLTHQRISGGIFAPAISYNQKNKTFYMITTNVGAGNFFVKTKDPSKGWSEPIYLPKVNGIDPSFFFDKNGQGYIVHNAPVDGGADYEGQRAIRIFKFDVNGDSIIGNHTQIVRGGTHVQKNPIWIEGPHLFRVGKYYYLMCAEGGTCDWHSEVIFRATNPMGPWIECPNNPILTQRTGLDPKRPDIVTSTGHADIVQSKSGDWWAVFLGCRPYQDDFYNTGRDTYLLPVTWKNGWPEILEKGKAVPTVLSKTDWQKKYNVADVNHMTGNFTYTDNFKDGTLDNRWIFLRNPSDFYKFTDGGLEINAKAVNISQPESPSAIFVRQQHNTFTAETELTFNPSDEHQLAGLVLLQNEEYNFVFGKTMRDGKSVVTLKRSERTNVTVASATLDNSESQQPLRLKVEGDGRYYSFYYAAGNGAWKLLASGVDAVNLSTHQSGGFIGACIGLYATLSNK
ncbi:glycoside hydrolase 43 family protein [Prevotella herbatica]|uniref:Glycoside hydrolase 43 family protein n=1 Tax=Prevotella herbatica TaxID=2801997 RepID=A0ABM7NY21_9BACT|nr:glycoside hydrolase family 43 protein [Prevotella herbatica]BCS85404.1 glycoside hydrolase 43 family protein [Prevotella herbatica]